MPIGTIAEVVFFLAFGISYFFPFRNSQMITAIAAIVVGVLMVVRL